MGPLEKASNQKERAFLSKQDSILQLVGRVHILDLAWVVSSDGENIGRVTTLHNPLGHNNASEIKKGLGVILTYTNVYGENARDYYKCRCNPK